MRRVDGETCTSCHDLPEANLPYTLPPASGEKPRYAPPTTRSRDSIRDALIPRMPPTDPSSCPRSTALHLRSNKGPLPDGRGFR